MTKAARAGLVRGAAIDLAPRAITANNVQPGPTAINTSSPRSAGRMPERKLVRESVGRAAEDRRVAKGVQRGAAAQFAGLSDSGGVCPAGSALRATPDETALSQNTNVL
jgi:3-oxoacyl-[acyl-carrier protein] reductase